ncbi:lytic transglycosylase domain-containing protein [Pseudochelatococcus contaminans]|uniref:Transglycosylase SLT domain-containing protein n=1 Tax=Pseudochelatococcus contaminans TaxID=1538103 RepID=A0A7W5Z5Y7_9HYPH|nr:lytic transglycosylase domain-containing protein [Pseudochelatococcus contaminans]MBB3810076.1 hypothetical protein [Pseudochelatococcus contaminans]
MPFSCSRQHHSHAFGQPRAARRITFLLLSGLCLAAVPTVAAHAQEMQQVGQAARDPLAAHVTAAAQRFGIPEHWIRTVMQAESAGDRTAVSSAGAMGLMQVMPDTWAELRIRHRLGGDPFEPRDNILAGTAYLREMLDRYGNIGAMLAAYNAGPGRYDEHLSVARELPAETRVYVATLVPLLGGDPLPPGALSGTARITDWREAPLFVTVAGRANPASETHDEHTASASLNALAAQANPLAPASSEALFVGRSPSGDAP